MVLECQNSVCETRQSFIPLFTLHFYCDHSPSSADRIRLKFVSFSYNKLHLLNALRDEVVRRNLEFWQLICLTDLTLAYLLTSWLVWQLIVLTVSFCLTKSGYNKFFPTPPTDKIFTYWNSRNDDFIKKFENWLVWQLIRLLIWLYMTKFVYKKLTSSIIRLFELEFYQEI